MFEICERGEVFEMIAPSVGLQPRENIGSYFSQLVSAVVRLQKTSSCGLHADLLRGVGCLLFVDCPTLHFMDCIALLGSGNLIGALPLATESLLVPANVLSSDLR